MISNLELIILFFIANILSISSNLRPELVHLTNSDCLLVKEDGIFRIKGKNSNKIEKVLSLREEQNSLASLKTNQNIYQFKCFGENICIFINNYIYIFSSDGDFIKKINISDENAENKFAILPYGISIKDINTFNYILLSVDSNGSVVNYFYSCNKNLGKNFLLKKNEIPIIEAKENIRNSKETDFTCQLISNSITCFFSRGINNGIIVKKFVVDSENKIIKLLNFIKPEVDLNFNGKIIKSFSNKEQSKILILYSSKDNKTKEIRKKCAIYDIISNKLEFPSEINEALVNHDTFSKFKFNFESNMEYLKSINKYVLYGLNAKNEICIIELDENFIMGEKSIYTLEKTVEISHFDIIDFSLVNYNRNYRIVLLINKNNNINNNKSFIIFSSLIKSFQYGIKRKLQGGSPGSGNGDSDPGTGGGDSDPGTGGGNAGTDGTGGGSGGGDPGTGGGNAGTDGTGGGNGGGDPGTGGGNAGTDGTGGGNGGGDPGTGGGDGRFDKRGERNGQTEGGFSFDFDSRNTSMPKDQIRDNRDSIMEYVEPGQSYELKGDDYSIRISPMGEKQEGSTSIDFRECEIKLREYYNLTANDTLSVFQTETTSTNNRSLTNKVQYVVYDENNTQLNLSVCENEQIKINFMMKNDSEFDLKKFSEFEGKGIDILNSSDPFFNDICYTYSDGTNDVILTDRINDIFQNFSLCDSGCEYEGLNSTSGVVSCTCPVDTSDEDSDDDDSANLKSIILSVFSDSTIGVVQCYNRVFSSKNDNIGFWVFLVIVVGHIPLYVWFFLKGNSQIKEYIDGEMKKYHYLDAPRENDNDNKNDNNEIKEELNEDHKDNPPKKSNASSEKKPTISRNVDSDLVKKSDHINLVKNTAETEGNEDINKDDLNINTINKNEKYTIQNERMKETVEVNKTNDSTSKREVNENIITVYKTEETLGEKEDKLEKKMEEKEANSAYFLIQIDANNSPDNDKPHDSNYVLNNYEYETAIKYESRSFWRILYIVMISKDNILNTFILRSPLESKPLRICLLLFAYTSDLALNTLFYFSDNISDKYHYTGKYLFWYTLFNNILISVISTILSMILGAILNLMADSKDDLEEEFKEEEKKLREDPNYKVSKERKNEILGKINKSLRKLKIKMTFFVIIDFLILLFFFYFVTAFCEIYSNTQTSWISDAVVSIIISFPIELAIALAITIIYNLSIKYKWKYVYKLAMFLM